MTLRGIRGAVTTARNAPDAIAAATREVLQAILAHNPTLALADIASAIFTVTDDVDAAFPAQAARQIGWEAVPMLCTREIPVPGALPLCIRVLIYWNTDLPQNAIRHIYLGAAASLRPDLARQGG